MKFGFQVIEAFEIKVNNIKPKTIMFDTVQNIRIEILFWRPISIFSHDVKVIN